MVYDIAVVGGGIVGLSTAWALIEGRPGARVLVLEKEDGWAAHQTGHNSGVIHSGIYYAPGSLKARYSLAGNASMVAFCEQHGLPYERCGKIIVATKERELPRLAALYQRGLDHGLAVRTLSPEEVREREPHVRCLSAIHVPSTGIVDYRQVCGTLAGLIAGREGDLRLGTRVLGMREGTEALELTTTRGDFQARFAVNCGGLHSDRLARLGGAEPEARIVPFRGEYYELVPERRSLVKGLIYPVPDPSFPFLGVHFTRMIDGSVHAGPNAVLSFKREGYRKTDVDLRDLAEVLSYPGFWRLALRHADSGAQEIVRSLSKAAFTRSLQEMIPEVQARDLVPCHSGVRAQALRGDGRLVDDFLIVPGRRSLHVCNAPSPAATASLEIGRAIAEQVPLAVPR